MKILARNRLSKEFCITICLRFLVRVTKTSDNIDELDLVVEPDFDDLPASCPG